MPTIAVNDATLAYTDSGLRDAPAIVFGHGLLFGGWIFRRQIAALRDSYRCITLDWRGQGASPAAREGYDMDTLTTDAFGLIRALDIAPVHWIGHSMGGFVGLRLAARHGELLRSLTLIDSSADAEDPAKIGEYKMLARIQRLIGIRTVIHKVAPIMFGPEFLASPKSALIIDEWVSRLGVCRRSALCKATLGVADRPAVVGEIGRITAPTLVMVGADDVATPPGRARAMAEHISGGTLHVLTGCGHTGPLEQPVQVTDLLIEFLATATQRA